MPQIIITQNAAKGLKRCRQFLSNKNPQAQKRAAAIIARHFKQLERQPHIGRQLSDRPILLRELVIQFGSTGYVALYHYDETQK